MCNNFTISKKIAHVNYQVNLQTQKKKNDLVTIAIKVTLNNRDRAEKALFSIDPKYFNLKTNKVSEKHENSNFYNSILMDELNKANNNLRQYEVAGKQFEAKDILSK